MNSNTTFNAKDTTPFPFYSSQLNDVTDALNESYANVSTDNPDTMQSLDFWIVKIVLYGVILLGSSIGNSLVIYIIVSNVRMRTGSNYLIMNLALCDFVTPVFSIPFDYFLEEYNYIWMYGSVMCKLLWPLTTMSSTSAALTLAAISLDRYRVIMHPFRPRLTKFKIKCIIVAVYVFSLLVVTPYSYVLDLKGHQCREIWPDISYKKYYTLGLFHVQYFLPLIFMVFMYSLALKNLYTSADKTSGQKAEQEPAAVSRKVSRTSTNSRRSSVAETEPKLKKVSSTVRLVRKFSSTVRRGKTEANKRATKMFMAVVGVFTICMFPNQALWLWADFYNEGQNPRFLNAVIICWLFTYANSVCNPVIYAVFSRDFRRGFKRAFRKVFCLHRRKNRQVYKTDMVETLTTELKCVASGETEKRKRKIATVQRPKLYLL